MHAEYAFRTNVQQRRHLARIWLTRTAAVVVLAAAVALPEPAEWLHGEPVTTRPASFIHPLPPAAKLHSRAHH